MKEIHSSLARKALPVGVRKSIKWFFYSGWPVFSARWLRRKLAGKTGAIYFYPENPRANHFPYAIKPILHQLGIRLAKIPSPGALAIRWEDKTVGRFDDWLEKLSSDQFVINAGCADISKSRVDEVFREVFGYSATVDPTTFHGWCVEKSEVNGLADGQMIQCPIDAPKEGAVYQRRIDTRVDDEFVDELRTPVFGKTIPFVLTKYKKADAPFAYSVKGTLDEVKDCLSEEEVALILEFCARAGLDCGELDVLRDRPTGKIYIIDANNTPTLHFAGYTKAEEKIIIRRMASAFDEAFQV